MSLKTAYYLAALAGSAIGSFIPTLWGAGFLSYSSVLLGGIGGILGMVIVYKSRIVGR